MRRPEESVDPLRVKARRVPEIQPTDLRDVASEERVERVWGRIEQDLDALRVRPAARPSRAVVWAVAATFAGLSTGLGAGRLLWRSSEPGASSPVVAARDLATVDVFAAGSQERSYSLPGGGTITLMPGSMVELERSGGRDLRLRLLSGEASLDTGQAPDQGLAIVSGEATVATAPGSMVRVNKRADNLDVRVVGGSAQVSSPAGSHALHKGEQMDDVPTRTTTAAVTPPVVRVSPALGPTARVARDAPVAAVAAAPSWLQLHAADKLDEATVALTAQSGSLSAAVASASSARELMAISDLASWRGRDPQAALAALTRVADSFPADAYGAIAAKQLAKHYAQSQPALAKKYLDQAAQKGVFSEDALCARMLSEEQAANKDEASARASEYLAKHPNGRCKDDANRILAGGDAAYDDERSPIEPAASGSAAPVAPPGSAPASAAPAAPAPAPPSKP